MRIGEKSVSKSGHTGEIVAYRTAKDIDVLIDGKYLREHIQYGNFKRGSFGSNLQPRICGVGYVGYGKYASKNPDGSHTDAYRKWHDMLCRIYREKELQKRPLYQVVSVCDEWLNFQNFAEWYYENLINTDEEIHIDKDIIHGEQKIYSPETCCLVPRKINTLFIREKKKYEENKLLPVGVQRTNGCINKYKAAVCVDGSIIHQGGFDSPEDAFAWYKQEKEKHIKEVADEYKEILPKRTYDALINYEVKPYPFTIEELAIDRPGGMK